MVAGHRVVIASRCPYFEELLSALPSNSVCQVECKLEIFSIMLKFIYYNHWAAPRVQQSRRKVDANFCCCGCIAMRKQIHHPFKTPSAQSTIRSKHHPFKTPSAHSTIRSKHHPPKHHLFKAHPLQASLPHPMQSRLSFRFRF